MCEIDFAALSNPFLEHKDWAVKDACAVKRQGEFFVFASAFFEVGGRERCHIACFSSRDFRTFQTVWVRDGDTLGAYGLASPDVTFLDGRYILTYNSWGDKPGEPNRLFYAVSPDLIHWQWDLPLAESVTRGVRAIDATLSRYQGKYLLCWKEIQKLAFAYADKVDSDHWIRVPAKLNGWYENGQFFQYEGKLLMIATGEGHNPYLLSLEHENGGLETLGCWQGRMLLRPPEQSFNTLERANAASLCTLDDGWNYIIYAGTTIKNVHAGRGDCKLGIARSRTLENWEAAKEDR